MKLEDPLVLQFINADGDEALSAFFGEYGLLDETGSDSIAEVLEAQKIRRGIINDINHIPEGERAERINALFYELNLRTEFDYSGPKQSGRMVFYATNLYDFMSVELSVAVMREVGVVHCAYCGNAFFTGQAAHRRIDAKTCSDRCRSGLRRRNATEAA